ncbi:hypothetical protein ROA7450_03236 [Roseovarius albus]|uniref:Uncharacterized protein n=1 Tax=Roseovarius albus TaxID=1247867 RepID=A0A1X6ZUI8_9RHOB|nr:hypothetical protein [Roseovarius albus]SLN61999.1 hypothetical protein ROA7450_03236 [Roseovarius albus]
MSQTVFDQSEVLEELQTILASTELAGAIRLQSFLRYVTEEELAGRGSFIRAKTIGEDLYGLLSNKGDDPLAVVRVDAGRLRRRLEIYYSKSDNLRTIRIYIDTGGYSPRFEQISPKMTEVSSDASHFGSSLFSKRRLYALASVGCVALFIAVVFGVNSQQKNMDNVATDAAIRQALFSASPAKLQAKNLSDEARDLMFPAVDRKRLIATLDLFEQSIKLDDEYYAGFAGAGQIYAMMASQMPPSSKRDTFLLQAQEMAERAVDLAPSASWAQSSMAMAAFAGKDCNEALKISKRAISLDPGDIYTLNFDGIISLFCGDFDRAVQVTAPWIGKSELAERLIFRNVAATAEYHRGNFQDTIDLYTAAINEGDPVGALTLAYLAAAHAKLNRNSQTKRNIELLNEAWPTFPLEQFLMSVYTDQSIASDIITTLKEAGWKSSSR